ncbi:oleosin-B6 [Scophthalmus maximus]|uniref:oleosin-B6 n=1 Tax=Scophthalmus maximus TaxID=52904 RepID=UPI001FA8B353|nr:oleosin-B6 [Scophthalmus maximus]
MPSSSCSSARPQTLTVLCVQIMCLAGWPLSSEASRLRCGTDLLSDLIFVCGDRGIYFGKGSWSGYGGRPRGKGIADMCCRPAGCELQQLEKYCAKPKSPQKPTIPPATTGAGHATIPPATTRAEHATNILPATTGAEHPAIPPATTGAEHPAIPPATTGAEHDTIPPATTGAEHPAIPPATTGAEHPAILLATTGAEHPAIPPATTGAGHATTTPLDTAQQFEAVFHKRLFEQLGAPDSPKRESYRKRTQPSVQRRGKGSSSNRRSKPENTSSRPSSASGRGMRLKS